LIEVFKEANMGEKAIKLNIECSLCLFLDRDELNI